MPTRLGRPVKEMEKGTSRGALRGARAADGSVLFGLNPAGQHYAMENFGELYLRGSEELVAAVGRGGASGYVLRSDLERVGGGDVPVYESDGATVIDTLSS